MCLATYFLKILAQHIEEGLLVALIRQEVVFLFSWLVSYHPGMWQMSRFFLQFATGVSYLLWNFACDYQRWRLQHHMPLSHTDNTGLRSLYIFGNPRGQEIPWKSAPPSRTYWLFGPVASEGSLAQIACAKTGFCGFRSMNEESNRDGQ